MYSGEYINIIDGGIQGPPGTGMPAGGLKDEILTKKSDANYDYEWKRFKTVLEKYEQIPEEELRDGLLWNNTSNDSIQYYDGNNIKSLLYSEGSRHDQVLCGSSLPGGNLILKSTSSETKGSIIIPEFNSAGIIISNENGHLTVITQLLPENLPSHSSLTAEFGVASKELYGHVKIGSGIIVDNGVIEVDISTGKGLRYIGENPNKYIEIDDTVVTLNDTQTLENKTLISPLLTSPIIHNGNSIIDENNNELLTFVANTYAKNNIAIENTRVSTGPRIYPVGEDINIDLILKAKGTGSVKVDNDIITTNNATQILTNKTLVTPKIINNDYISDVNGNKLLAFGSTPTATTYLKLTNNISENDVILEVLGSTNAGLNIKPSGSGTIQINNDIITTNNANQTLENKTLILPLLISPIIHNGNSVIDENNNELLTFVANTYAKNNIAIENARVSTGPKIYPVGEDTNIDLILKAKGTGSVKVDNDIITTNNANQILNNKTLITPIISELYQDIEKTNKILFPDISDTVVTLNAEQILANKTLATPKIINNDYISDVNGNKLLAFGSTPTATTYLKLTNNISENDVILEVLGSTNAGLNIKPSGSGTIQINNDIITTNNANQTLSNKILIEPIIDNLINANHDHSNNINGGQITDAALSSPVTPAKGGTGFSSYTLGDIIYAASNNTLSKLPGNTTTDTKLLAQTGTGTASNAPEWKKYKHEEIIGDGLSDVYEIDHNLNTRAHTISVWRNTSPYDEIDYYVEKTTPNKITLYFSRVLQPNEFSVVIIG